MMMRLATALAALTMTAPAAAQTTSDEAAYFQQFDRFCLSTGGDMRRAVAAAEAEGWIVAPQAMLDEAANPDAAEIAIRLSGPADAGPSRLLLSTTPPLEPGGEVRVTACAIEPAPSARLDQARMKALVQAHLGFGSALPTIWAYSGDGPFTDEAPLMSEGMPVISARARTSPIYMLSVGPSSDESVAMALMRVSD